MLQYIQQATKNFFQPLYDAYDEKYTVIQGKIPESGFFTHSELQKLQSILADKINDTESIRLDFLENANYFKDIGKQYASTVCFKNHRKLKAEMKKLVALQQKVKHSLITMG